MARTTRRPVVSIKHFSTIFQRKMKIEKVDCEDHLNDLAIKNFMILSENSSSFPRK